MANRPLPVKAIAAALILIILLLSVALTARYWQSSAGHTPLIEEEEEEARPPAGPPVAAPALAIDNTDTSATVLELFKPDDSMLKKQMDDTALRRQAEQLLATTFVLSHCGLITDRQYGDGFEALIVFVERKKLAANAKEARKKVMRIARDSGQAFATMHSNVDCANPKLPEIAQQMVAWQNHYLGE
jgi:hypothetical protein